MWEFLINPWPWWFSGAAISVTMFALILFGRSFGFSSNLRTLCAIASRRRVKFFDFDWKKEVWNLIFLVGAIIGGYLASTTTSCPARVREVASDLGSARSISVQSLSRSAVGRL